MSRATQDTTTIYSILPLRDFHPLWLALPKPFKFFEQQISWSYNPKIAETTLVWACPISLATTLGITIVFSSSRYLDVSVPWVYLLNGYYIFNIVGFPIRKSADQIVCANPRSLSQLITSFFASESLGIPHTPLFCLLYFLLF